MTFDARSNSPFVSPPLLHKGMQGSLEGGFSNLSEVM